LELRHGLCRGDGRRQHDEGNQSPFGAHQYCPEDGFRNPANPMQGKGLNAVLVFFDLKSEESKAAFSEENR
jgi:hypothetical protein